MFALICWKLCSGSSSTVRWNATKYPSWMHFQHRKRASGSKSDLHANCAANWRRDFPIPVHDIQWIASELLPRRYMEWVWLENVFGVSATTTSDGQLSSERKLNDWRLRDSGEWSSDACLPSVTIVTNAQCIYYEDLHRMGNMIMISSVRLRLQSYCESLAFFRGFVCACCDIDWYPKSTLFSTTCGLIVYLSWL